MGQIDLMCYNDTRTNHAKSEGGRPEMMTWIGIVVIVVLIVVFVVMRVKR
jgi:hypothetical protein